VKKDLISIAWMLGVLILAGVLDQLYEQALAGAAQRFEFGTLLWLKLSFTLLFVAATLGLAWFALCQGNRNPILSLSFMGTGLLLMLSMTLPGYRFWTHVLQTEFVRQLIGVEITSSLQLASIGAAFIAVIGIVGLTPFGQIELVESPLSGESDDGNS
jgi:hypothetical protein